MATSKTFFVLLSLLPLLIVADNDWSTPCLNGWCSYDVPASENSMAATIQITGSPYAISDITSAAGWEILDCTADSDAQDIRIVCSGDETSCSHLFENGAEHTVVRLPPQCGSVPFAHVTACGESDDQSLPDHVKSRIMRRDGTTPPVHALSFSSNFDEVPASQHGDVSMLVFGSTIPGFNGNAVITAAGSRRRSRLVDKRGLFDSHLGDFSGEKSTDLPPISIDKSFNIFNTTLSCSENEQAKLSVDVNAKVDAEVTIAFVIAGTVIPLKLKEFGLFSDVSADLEGGLSINANIAGEIDTGKVPLFSQGLPTLSIPKIITLGPSFEINAQALATIDLDVNMSVDLSYSFSNLQLFFPPSDDHPSNAVVAPKDTPLKLSASPNVASNAKLEVHLIPTLKFGLSVLTSKADIFLDLDTFAALDLSLQAGATGSVDTTGATDTSAQIGGCIDVNGGVSVNAGADASLFKIFDKSTQVSLFSKNFDFFKKCFEESTSTSDTSSVTDAPSSTETLISTSATSGSADSTASDCEGVTSQSIDPTDAASAVVSSAPSDPVGTSEVVDSPSPIATDTITPADPDLVTPSLPDDVTSDASLLSTATSATGADSITETTNTDISSATIDGTPDATDSATISDNLRGRGLGRGKRQRLAGKMMKRDFQCLAPGVATAASVVDQTLSSSSFS